MSSVIHLQKFCKQKESEFYIIRNDSLNDRFDSSLYVTYDILSAEAIKSDPSLDDTSVAVPETSSFAATFQPVKMEITTNEEEKVGRVTQPKIPVRKDTSEQIEISFTPTIKPRKYSLKPEVYFHHSVFITVFY